MWKVATRPAVLIRVWTMSKSARTASEGALAIPPACPSAAFRPVSCGSCAQVAKLPAAIASAIAVVMAWRILDSPLLALSGRVGGKDGVRWQSGAVRFFFSWGRVGPPEPVPRNGDGIGRRRFGIAAVHAQLAVAEGLAGEAAEVRSLGVIAGVGPEEPAAHAGAQAGG